MNRITNYGKKFFQASLITGFITSGVIFYREKDLRRNPIQIAQGSYRQIRVLIAGIRMTFVYKNYFSKLTMEERHEQAAIILRKCFEKNAGTYIKLGQVLASLELLIPKEYCKEMEKMFEQAPNSSFEKIQLILEEELGRDWQRHFKSINPKPISSASLAQVHEGMLLNGDKVAIKIQHPWIKENIWLDISTVSFFLETGKKLFKNFDYTWISDDMKKTFPQEVDFLNEVKNCKKIEKLLKNKQIYTPKIYKNLCTSKILVLEYINGYTLTNTQRLKEDGIDISTIAQILNETFAQLIFKDGFFHADPHPGNIFVQKLNKKDFRLVLLDHGLYKELDKQTIGFYSELWTGIILQDEQLIKNACQSIGVGKHYRLFTSIMTYQKYDQVMAKNKDINYRLKGNENEEQYKARAKKEAIKHQGNIINILREMDKNFLLIMKVNNYMNSIDSKLGKPINNYYYTAKYSMSSYYKYQLKNQNIITRMHFLMQYYRTTLSLILYELLLKFKYYLNY